jgi:GTP cyclohydrolase III
MTAIELAINAAQSGAAASRENSAEMLSIRRSAVTAGQSRAAMAAVDVAARATGAAVQAAAMFAHHEINPIVRDMQKMQETRARILNDQQRAVVIAAGKRG